MYLGCWLRVANISRTVAPSDKCIEDGGFELRMYRGWWFRLANVSLSPAKLLSCVAERQDNRTLVFAMVQTIIDAEPRRFFLGLNFFTAFVLSLFYSFLLHRDPEKRTATVV